MLLIIKSYQIALVNSPRTFETTVAKCLQLTMNFVDFDLLHNVGGVYQH